MKLVRQFLIILLVSLLGELLRYLLPLPVPASVYGMALMLLCLCTCIIRLEQVERAADFLIEIMPVMFIPAAVGLITSWAQIRTNLLAYLAITLVSTVLVMAVSGRVAQRVVRHARKEVTPK